MQNKHFVPDAHPKPLPQILRQRRRLRYHPAARPLFQQTLVLTLKHLPVSRIRPQIPVSGHDIRAGTLSCLIEYGKHIPKNQIIAIDKGHVLARRQ